MRKSIEKGKSLCRVANSSKMFTQFVLQMTNMGEETSWVDELLAEFYKQQINYEWKSFTSKIKPILISIVAVMVLVLALGIFTLAWDMLVKYKVNMMKES
jgi:MSHA biogenesis protein MshG